MEYTLNELVKQITHMTIEKWFFNPDLFMRDGKVKTTIFPDGQIVCEHYTRTEIKTRLKKGEVKHWHVNPEEVLAAYREAAEFLFLPAEVENYVDDTDGLITLHLGRIEIRLPRGLTFGEKNLQETFWGFSEPEDNSKQEG